MVEKDCQVYLINKTIHKKIKIWMQIFQLR